MAGMSRRTVLWAPGTPSAPATSRSTAAATSMPARSMVAGPDIMAADTTIPTGRMRRGPLPAPRPAPLPHRVRTATIIAEAGTTAAGTATIATMRGTRAVGADPLAEARGRAPLNSARRPRVITAAKNRHSAVKTTRSGRDHLLRPGLAAISAALSANCLQFGQEPRCGDQGSCPVQSCRLRSPWHEPISSTDPLPRH